LPDTATTTPGLAHIQPGLDWGVAGPRKPASEAYDLVVENLPLNDEGWRALEKRVQARQPTLRAQYLIGFDRYGRPQATPGQRRGLRVAVTARSRGDAVTEARRRIETALAGWKDLQFYDPSSAVASARITVLPKPKPATPAAGGAPPDRRSGT
jgi:hypothetical protein